MKGNKYNGAIFSPCERYRYILWRYDRFPSGGRRPTSLCVVGLNPSTADELVLDPTCRKCKYFSKQWGYEGYIMLNIFGLRSTDPGQLTKVANPISHIQQRVKTANGKFMAEINDHIITRVTNSVHEAGGKVLCAWGNHGDIMQRGLYVREMLKPITDLYALKINSSGHPKHPLYCSNNSQPKLWSSLEYKNKRQILQKHC